jgi:PhzF family phenazine biosynthesis protein
MNDESWNEKRLGWEFATRQPDSRRLKMGITIWQVDAFTDRPFGGNPAGVCILDGLADQDWMQAVGMEMNLSETAFLFPEGAGYRLRWFTPATEVDLCGHATLASAHVLFTEGLADRDRTVEFYTLSGTLKAKLAKDGWIELDFPKTPAEPFDPPPGLVEALGVRPVWVGRSRFDYLIEVEHEELVRNSQPDFTALKKAETRGVIVTSRSASPERDFVSRFFAPAVGIDEDPVTGSAHCVLGPYWSEKLGKKELTAFQASKRGGVVRVRLEGDRVYLGGQAITAIKGVLG